MTALNLWQRIAAAQTAVDYIQKEKKPGMNYSIVSHDVVTAKVRPALLTNGVVYYPTAIETTQDGNRTQVQLTVRFVNVDKPDEFFDVPSLGYGIDQQDKGPGKAISYAVKYALLKTLGLETGDDPDLDQNVKHEPAPANDRKKYDHSPIVRAAYETIDKVLNQIAQTGNLDDLRVFWNDPVNKKTIADLPADYRTALTEKKDEIKEQLAGKAAA